MRAAGERINAFNLCRLMGWTWAELESTPSDVADDFLYILTHGQR
jgi:hypothetical protein